MFNDLISEVMKKQVYSQPVISIVEMQAENLMTLSVSVNNNGNGEVHAPGRRIGDVIY